MKTISNIYLLANQVKDTVQALGHAEAAKKFKKKVPFTIFYFFAFGRLPTTRLTSEGRVIKCI